MPANSSPRPSTLALKEAGRTGFVSLRSVVVLILGSSLLWASAKVQVPFWPVPITLQTYVVLSVGALFGWRLGAATVAAYLIPQVMAYAQIAGLPPAAGLLAIVAPTLAYVVLGSSRQLSVGPESTTALMTAAAVAAVGVNGPDAYAALAAALAVVTGTICVLGWAFGLGFLADLLSKPVLVGYLAGVAVLMVVSQLDTLTGITVEGESLPEQLWSAVRHLDEVHGPTLALSTALLVLLLVAARLWPRLPNPLFAVLLGAGAVALFHLGERGVAVVGPLPDAVPGLSLPDLSPGSVLTMIGVPVLYACYYKLKPDEGTVKSK